MERLVSCREEVCRGRLRRRPGGRARREPVGEAAALRLAQAQPELGAPPQDIVGGPRPFVADEVLDLALVETVPKCAPSLSARRRRRCAAPWCRRSRRGAPRWPHQSTERWREIGRGSSPKAKSPPGSVAPRVQRAVAGERRGEPLQRLLGEAAVGGDLAADDVEQRRLARGRRVRARSRASPPAPRPRPRRTAGARPHRTRPRPRARSAR